MEERTDTELVAFARSNDTYAFELLMERYRLIAFYIARRMVADREIAQELLQEATLQAYLALDQLRDAARFKNWFYRIVFNICSTWLRERKSPMLSLETLGEDWQGSGTNEQDPQEILETRELHYLVREAIDILSPKNRIVTRLFYYEQLSIVEISAQLNISQAAVKNRLHRGRNELRKSLKVIYPEVEQMTPVMPGKRKRKTMLQVTILRVIQQGRNNMVMLFDEQGQRVLPLWLRREESQTLVGYQMAQSPEDFPLYDPSSIDFMVNILNATGDTVEEVCIDVLQEEILYATVRLRRDKMLHEIKARVGEALSLAVRTGGLIFVAQEVLDQLGMKLSAEEGDTREQPIVKLEKKLLWDYLPPRALIADATGIAKHPQNLDFRQGMQGWRKTRTLEFTMDTTIIWNSEASASLKSIEGQTKGWLTQAFLADEYREKRLRLVGWIKTQDMLNSGLWITIEGLNQTIYRATRWIQGAHDWTLCMVEIDVPMETISLHIGFLMIGTGPVWLDKLQLEEVPELALLRSPQNLNFEQELLYWVPSDQMDVKKGSLTEGYDYGIDRLVKQQGAVSAYLKMDIPKSRKKDAEGDGVLKQIMLADNYRGKRLRLSGTVKAEGVKYRTGLFLGVQGPDEMLSLDEMENRPIQGTQDWKRYEVSVMVPEASEFITFGMVLYGIGQVWLEDVRLEGEEPDNSSDDAKQN